MINDYDNIPQIMRDAPRWLLWRLIPRKDTAKKPRKVPFYCSGEPRSGELDSAADLANFATFEAAYSAFTEGNYTGFGFALGPDGTGNYWQGVDFDVVSKRPILGLMVEDMPGYTELSPSGDGWHSIGYGRKFESMGSNESGIEAYSSGRYFTVTGECSGIADPCCIADYVEQSLKPLHTPFIVKEQDITLPLETISPKNMAALRSALLYMHSDDRELWQKNGHRLKGLGDAGRGLWFEWSSQSASYDPPEDAKTWESFHPTHTGYRSIFTEAQKLGWINPGAKIPDEYDYLTWSCGDTLADNAIAPKYLINNVLETDSHGMFAGDSMAFKTFVDLRMAYSVCTGRDFMGNEVYETGKVLYVCGEGKGSLARRIKAIKLVESDFMGNLLVLDNHLMIDSTVDMSMLKIEIDKYNPILVIFDTFGSLVGNTDENSASDVGRALRLVKETCRNGTTSSMIVHHYGKDGSKGMRGSIAFKANTDFEFSLERQASTMITVMECVKMKDGENFYPIAMEAHIVDLGLVRQDGNTSTSLVIKKSTGDFKNNSGMSFLTGQILGALELAIEEIGSNFYHNSDVVKSVTLDDFRRYAYPFFNVKASSRRTTLKRHIDLMINFDKIMFYNDNLWLLDSVTGCNRV